jgi:hypothetical protein
MEAYNQQIELMLGGDHCHNIDRIMRLPGTINVPNAKKRKLGRQEALASVVEADWELAYDLGNFEALEGEPKLNGEISLGVVEVRKIETLDALDEWACPAWLKSVIATGQREANEVRYPSRSEALFAVVGALYRAGVPPEIILGVQLDSRFKISESVLEKSNPAEYAKKQLARVMSKHKAPTNADEVVAFINQTYFAINEGGKIAFYREDGIELEALTKELFEFELKPHYLVISDENSHRRVPWAKLWMAHLNRRYYSKGFILEQKSEAGEGYYNLWKGFWYEPQQGSWLLMQKHILEVLANNDPALADYITRWAAWAVQNPSTPARVALVFKGGEGIGKGTFCNAMVNVFGAHGLRVHSMGQLVGRFNAHLRLCCLLFADEVMVPKDDNEGALKGLISEATIPIERKGFDIVQSPNRLHVVMATNNDWAVPSGIGARRYAVFRVAETYKGQAKYFNALFGELENGGYGAMLFDLLKMDLKGWHPEANRPDTHELTSQKAHSLKGVEQVWFDYLQTGYLPEGARKVAKQSFLVPTASFTADVASRQRFEVISMNKVAMFFKDKMKFAKYREGRPSGFLVPPLAQAREVWDKNMFRYEWEEGEFWEIDVPDHF